MRARKAVTLITPIINTTHSWEEVSSVIKYLYQLVTYNYSIICRKSEVLTAITMGTWSARKKPAVSVRPSLHTLRIMELNSVH